MFEHLLSLFIKAIFVENMALAFFLGMWTLWRSPRKIEAAVGWGLLSLSFWEIYRPNQQHYL